VALPGESGVPDWKTFARSGEWRRAQAAASLTGADPDIVAALSSLSALQADVRARKYPAARRSLSAYEDALSELNTRAQGEAALLRSLAAPEVLTQRWARWRTEAARPTPASFRPSSARRTTTR